MDGKQIVQRSADTWNARDQDGFLADYADDCDLSAPGWVGKGRQGLLEFWAINMDPFPDNRVVVRRLVEEGGCIVEEGLFEGTHTAPMPAPDGSEIPATGRQMSMPFAAVHEIAGDRITSTRFYYDQLEMLTQLGLTGG